VYGKTAAYVMAHEGVSAIDKAWLIIAALHELEARKNENLSWPWVDLGRPIHANVFGIQGGEWVGSVAGKCIVEATIGFLPPQTLDDARAELVATVAKAAAGDAWLVDHPPQVTFTGLAVPPLDMGVDNAVVLELARAHESIMGYPLRAVAITGFTDPGCLFTPGGGGAAHATDEYFDLSAMAPATKVALEFVMAWCGTEEE